MREPQEIIQAPLVTAWELHQAWPGSTLGKCAPGPVARRGQHEARKTVSFLAGVMKT